MSSAKKIPILSSLGIALTGCTDQIAGEWTAVKGGDNTFPYTTEQCYGGYSYYYYDYSYDEYCSSYTIDMW